MTNGKKIQTILDVDRDCTEVHGENGTMTFTVTQDFWNAEYKEPTTKDNLVVDCIDRKKLIDWINIWGITPIIKNPLIRHIQGMSSVTPQEPRKGHWDIKDNMWWVCSACGCKTRMIKKYNVPNFCPACGADMREVEE